MFKIVFVPVMEQGTLGTSFQVLQYTFKKSETSKCVLHSWNKVTKL